jgi:hypothetical protein
VDLGQSVEKCDLSAFKKNAFRSKEFLNEGPLEISHKRPKAMKIATHAYDNKNMETL